MSKKKKKSSKNVTKQDLAELELRRIYGSVCRENYNLRHQGQAHWTTGNTQ